MSPNGPVKFYLCGTAWGWETVPENGGELEVYMSPEALREDQRCAKSCGIVEVEATEIRWIQPAEKPMKGKTWAEVTVEQEQYGPVGKNLSVDALAQLNGNLDLAINALTRALGILKRKRRETLKNEPENGDGEKIS